MTLVWGGLCSGELPAFWHNNFTLSELENMFSPSDGSKSSCENWESPIPGKVSQTDSKIIQKERGKSVVQLMICLKYLNYINLWVYSLWSRLRVLSVICHFHSHILIIVISQEHRAVLLNLMLLALTCLSPISIQQLNIMLKSISLV